MVDTNKIRRQLLNLTRKATDKRIDRLANDVMDLCDEYDQLSNIDRIIAAGESSLDHSFSMIEKLRKSL